MKVVYFLTLVCAILTSCRNKAPEKKDNAALIVAASSKEVSDSLLFDIDLYKVIQDAEETQLPLSTFFKEIEYIPLQTTAKSLIGGGRHGIQQHLVTDKVIVADMKIFSREDGHYIGNLLKYGQGPEEYLFVLGLDADDDREEFYIYDSSRQRVHIAGYDNTYKGAIGGCGDYANVFSFGNGNILIPNNYSISQRSDAFFIDNVDTKEVVYKRISPALQGISSFKECKRLGKMGSQTCVIGSIGNIFWKYKDEIRYYDTLNDTVYAIDKKYQIKPFGYLDTEKIRMTLDQWKIGMMSRNFYTYDIMSIFESSSCILFFLVKSNTVTDESVRYWIVFSKKDKSIRVLENNKINPKPPFFNDLDQVPSLYLGFSTSTGDGIYTFLSAESIKDYIAQKGPDYFTTEKGKAFKAMGDRLKYDDNEVVAILK